MSTAFAGTLFTGETLATKAVVLTPMDARLRVTGEDHEQEVPVSSLRVSDRLGALPRYLYLPDGPTIVTPDNNAVDVWLVGQRRGRLIAFIHWLELRSRVAAVATVLLVASVAVTIWWALPVLARKAAMAVPVSVEAQAGKAGLATIDRILAPTQLGFTQQRRVRTQLDRLIKAGGFKDPPQIIFRSMGGHSPNAFALPGGLIVVSDELVKLAEADEEIAAVLAHEIGHWQRRHGLQSVLRGSSALLVVSTVTGDLSTLTTFAGTIPFLLLQRGYSREFEEEADEYALGLLAAARIDRRYFVSILKKLEDARPTAGQDFTYLSTHPSTGDRISKIDPAGTSAAFLAQKNAATAPRVLGFSFEAPSAPSPDHQGPVAGPDTKPRALYQPPADYPLGLQAAGVEGTVTVGFVIDEKGDVRAARVIRSTHREFEAAALAAIASWKFLPGQHQGRTIAIRSQIEIQFRLPAATGAPVLPELQTTPTGEPPPGTPEIAAPAEPQ